MTINEFAKLMFLLNSLIYSIFKETILIKKTIFQ